MGAFFIRFVIFASNLVYSVVWDQYIKKCFNNLDYAVAVYKLTEEHKINRFEKRIR